VEAHNVRLARSLGQAVIYSATRRPTSAVTVVRLGPNIVVGNRVLARAMLEATHSKYGGVIIADLTDVADIDASGLGALVTARKRIQFAGGDLEIAAVNEDLRVLLEITKLDTLFTIHDRAPEPAP
jgi:anti-sigma B factor antagonist